MCNIFPFCFVSFSANAVLLSRLGKMDRKLDAITKMMRKVMNEGE